MPTLGQILETQHQGITQNPYKYKIVDILQVFDASKEDSDLLVKDARDGKLYLTAESIPQELYNRLVYAIEPGIMEHGCLYLRIVII